MLQLLIIGITVKIIQLDTTIRDVFAIYTSESITNISKYTHMGKFPGFVRFYNA